MEIKAANDVATETALVLTTQILVKLVEKGVFTPADAKDTVITAAARAEKPEVAALLKAFYPNTPV